ncbi:MAG: hypothetical protein JSV77_11115 [Dehalococcoidales bacterium]|nr:MAG: hypothetical protein JSV77_11115 [Dehalococcoidales bacterium]
MPDEVMMEEQELIEQLENVKLPQIEMADYQSRLKMALLESDYLGKRREVVFMEVIKVRAVGALDSIAGGLITQQPVWKVILATVLTAAVIGAAVFAGYSIGPQKASPFPEGSMEVGGPQLTAEQKELALTILMADAGVQELLRQGAIIEPDLVLPLEVVMTKTNDQTGEIEEIRETWAQAWIQVGDSVWGAKVDLVRSIVVSLSE